MTVTARGQLFVRRMVVGHLAAAAGLINTDGLPGQPPCTVQSLFDALVGRVDPDPLGRNDLDTCIDVVGNDGIKGLVAYARRRSEDTGLILWLHGMEQPGIIGRLLDHALHQLADCSVVEAFDLPTVLDPLAVPGLAALRRPVTAGALLSRGFTSRPCGRYLHRRLPSATARRDEGIRYELYDGLHQLKVVGPTGATLADATLSLPYPRHAVLHWIGVEPEHRRHGLGRRLLHACLQYARTLGADQLVCHVDDHNLAADDDRGRSAAIAMYHRVGFTSVVHLTSYARSRPN
ncbi:GNAT family N-acetyltransferase [Kribbella deserti]|uniref:GNAT family N-acetyltransferase n=1 Tax=Kribbella deserti TaxID=1926257 RepID=A0ABV6QWM6_9ACTN